MKEPEIHTARLILRRWCGDDLAPFAAMNADQRVMEYFPTCLSRGESDDMAARIDARFDELGFGLWAVEIPGHASFAGFVGSPDWGQGYTTEAARAAVAFGFERVGLNEIVAFTVPANIRSRRVMEKIGMTRNPADDFNHPRVPDGHPLRRHVLYRIQKRNPRNPRPNNHRSETT